MIGIEFGGLQDDAPVAGVRAMRAAAVDLLFNTAPALYGYQFGHDRQLFDALVGAAWIEKDNLFSHNCTIIAREGDELIGMLTGCHGHQFQHFARALGPVFSGQMEKGAVSAELMSVLRANGPHCSYLTPKIPDKAFYILGLSVNPTYQGRGIGVRLFHMIEGQALSEGATSLHLDVISENGNAIKFYSAMGMHCVAETRSPEAHRNGVPMMMRLVKSLA